VAAG
jgi:uncharacterized membrane protein